MRDLRVISVADALTDYDAATGAEATALATQNTGIIAQNAAIIVQNTALAAQNVANAAQNVAILAETNEIERHIHNHEHWFGISGDQSGNDWALEHSLNPFRATSGNNDFGTAIKVIGTADTPITAGEVKFDLHRMFLVDASEPTPFYVRVIFHATSSAAGISADSLSDFVIAVDPTNPQQSSGYPLEVKIPRLDVGVDKVWVDVKNATNNATLDFFIGVHEYPE